MSNDQQLNTFARSCRHWSEDAKTEMDAFYQLATVDYHLLAKQLDWGKLFDELSDNVGSRIRLLDVACGSGQFPAALLKQGRLDSSKEVAIDYSLLDPSQFSIDTARSKLAAPFEPDAEFQCTIQQFVPTASKYSLLWATHALYCVPPREIDVGIERMLGALDHPGIGFIAHASRQSHYIQFHDLYLQGLRAEPADPFTTGEQIIESLKTKLSTDKLQYWSIEYEGTVDLQAKKTAERYLQRCLFDDSLSLDDMMQDQRLRKYLENCQNEARGQWRFPQKVWLIFFGELAESIAKFRLSEEAAAPKPTLYN